MISVRPEITLLRCRPSYYFYRYDNVEADYSGVLPVAVVVQFVAYVPIIYVGTQLHEWGTASTESACNGGSLLAKYCCSTSHWPCGRGVWHLLSRQSAATSRTCHLQPTK